MAHHPRVFEERVFALENMIVGAADADMADGNAHPTLGKHGRALPLDNVKAAGFNADDRLHLSGFRGGAAGRNRR